MWQALKNIAWAVSNARNPAQTLKQHSFSKDCSIDLKRSLNISTFNDNKEDNKEWKNTVRKKKSENKIYFHENSTVRAKRNSKIDWNNDLTFSKHRAVNWREMKKTKIILKL